VGPSNGSSASPNNDRGFSSVNRPSVDSRRGSQICSREELVEFLGSVRRV